MFIYGGADLPQPMNKAVAVGDHTKVPIIIGTNPDEGRVFAMGMADWTKHQYVSYVDSTFRSLAPKVLEL